MITTHGIERASSEERDPYEHVADLLPKLAQPHWVSLIAPNLTAPQADTPAVAKGRMQDQKRRARRSLKVRGVAGFLSALKAA